MTFDNLSRGLLFGVALLGGLPAVAAAADSAAPSAMNTTPSPGAGAPVAAGAPAAASATAATDDPWLWLEDIKGDKALGWVKARNAETVARYASTPAFDTLRRGILEALDSDARIPYVSKHGPYYYNFWRDGAHPLGLWRRTTLDEYRKDAPRWDVILDVDALAKAENEKWVWHGAQCLRPEYRHCLVSLSRGGGDATVVREFDIETRTFVKDGFALPEAKSEMDWIDIDHVFVSTDFGPGSMTKSSYPRIVKRWTRGTPLSSATLVSEVTPDDLAVSANHDDTPGFERDFVTHVHAFYAHTTFERGADGALAKIDIPRDAQFGVKREWMTVETRSPWTVGGATYPAGALLAIDYDAFMKGARDFTVLFTPDDHTSLAGASWTRHHLILNTLRDVVSHVEVLTPGKGAWKRETLGDTPAMSNVGAMAVDGDESDAYFMTVTGFLEPTTLYYGALAAAGEPAAAAAPLKHAPRFFDGSGYTVSQHFVTSKDGTRVPYFMVAPKAMKLDGRNPTLVYGYGGFEDSLHPWYSATMGRGWISRGGVLVVANIRGGGEYGPRWHQAALKANRLRAYEDFAAVAQDLVARKVTSSPHMGAMGGSNGGLLVGNMLTLYPGLFGAIVCQVPLLDMKRYTHLSAGASWMAEYGDPDDPAQWEFIRRFSPYQNVQPGVKYPPVLFTTSTLDDRVGPVQARKMAAKMQAMGYDASFYENTEGGHAGSADNSQAAFMTALEYSYLYDHLK